MSHKFEKTHLDVSLSSVASTFTGPLDLTTSVIVDIQTPSGTAVESNLSLSELSTVVLNAPSDSKTNYVFVFEFPLPPEELCFSSSLQNGSFETPYVNPQSIISTSTSGLSFDGFVSAGAGLTCLVKFIKRLHYRGFKEICLFYSLSPE